MANYEVVKSSFTQEEREKLDKINKEHCFTNSLVDFHESNDEDDDGSTVFTYTETRRYM